MEPSQAKVPARVHVWSVSADRNVLQENAKLTRSASDVGNLPRSWGNAFTATLA